MGRILGGDVSFERVRKDDEYGVNRKAGCRLSFEVAEGTTQAALEKFLASTSLTAVNLVQTALGFEAVKATAAATVTVTTAGPEDAKAGKGAAAAPKEVKPKKAAAKPPAADEIPDDAPAAEEVADAAEVVEDDLMAPAAAKITEQDLTDGVSKHNQKVQNPQAIRALIGKYVSAPKTVRDIPEAVRAEFLEKLHKIGPVAK